MLHRQDLEKRYTPRRGWIMIPKQFLAIYRCVCGEEYEMENCYVPYVWLPCDWCGDRTKFSSEKMIHTSFEWDETVAD